MQAADNQKIYIAGIGAIGSLLACRLTEENCAINLILKNEEQLTSYQQSGLTINYENENYNCHPQANTIDNLGDTPIKYLIACVKAYDILNLLMSLKSNLNERSIIILLNNGLGVLDEIKIQLPKLRIISGICTIGAYLETPFNVNAFLNGKFHIGSINDQFSHDEIEFFYQTFKKSNLPMQWEENIKTIIWEKFALNCSINMLTVILSCKNGGLLAYGNLLKELTEEIATVITAYGINIDASSLLKKVTSLLQNVSENYSSMYCDVKSNKPTEISHLNEYLIKLAKEKNISAKLNSKLLGQFYRAC
jgi:2-dehydropantoate 2-reductase